MIYLCLLINFWIGDSIAHGYRVYRSEEGITRIGNPPSKILKEIKGINSLKGKNVYLSTGYANLPDTTTIKIQIKELKKRSPNRIYILGLAKKNKIGNNFLRDLSSKNGCIFIGPFTPSLDGIHPKSYKVF